MQQSFESLVEQTSRGSLAVETSSARSPTAFVPYADMRAWVTDCGRCTVLITSMDHSNTNNTSDHDAHRWILRSDRTHHLVVKHSPSTRLDHLVLSFVSNTSLSSPTVDQRQPLNRATHDCCYLNGEHHPRIPLPPAGDDTASQPERDGRGSDEQEGKEAWQRWRAFKIHENQGCAAICVQLKPSVCRQWDLQMRRSGEAGERLQGYLQVQYELRDVDGGSCSSVVQHFIPMTRHTGASTHAQARKRERVQHSNVSACRAPVHDMLKNPMKLLRPQEEKGDGEAHPSPDEELHNPVFEERARRWWRRFIRSPQVRKEAEDYLVMASQLRHQSLCGCSPSDEGSSSPLPTHPWTYPDEALSMLLSPFVAESSIVNLHPHSVTFVTSGRTWFSNTGQCVTPSNYAETINRLRYESTCLTEWHCTEGLCEQRGRYLLHLGATYALHPDLSTLTRIETSALSGHRAAIHNPVQRVHIHWESSGLPLNHPLRHSRSLL